EEHREDKTAECDEDLPVSDRERFWAIGSDCVCDCHVLCSVCTFAASCRDSTLRVDSAFLAEHCDGTWRSPVAHLNGVQGAAGSNPAVPIRKTLGFRRGFSLSGR